MRKILTYVILLSFLIGFYSFKINLEGKLSKRTNLFSLRKPDLKKIEENKRIFNHSKNLALIKSDTIEYSELFNNSGNINFNHLFKKSKELKKPILLYFTGYSSINARKIEKFILEHNEIAICLKNDFIFVNIYTDDKNLLPKNEWIEDKKNGEVIKTIGNKYKKLQFKMVENNYVPYFAIIDYNGNKLKELNYTEDIKTIKEFLSLIR